VLSLLCSTLPFDSPSLFNHAAHRLQTWNTNALNEPLHGTYLGRWRKRPERPTTTSPRCPQDTLECSVNGERNFDPTHATRAGLCWQDVGRLRLRVGTRGTRLWKRVAVIWCEKPSFFIINRSLTLVHGPRERHIRTRGWRDMTLHRPIEFEARGRLWCKVKFGRFHYSNPSTRHSRRYSDSVATKLGTRHLRQYIYELTRRRATEAEVLRTVKFLTGCS
jgi:hypothetical protein